MEEINLILLDCHRFMTEAHKIAQTILGYFDQHIFQKNSSRIYVEQNLTSSLLQIVNVN